MQSPKKNNIELDKVGMWLSGVCAIHCSVLPIMLAFGVGSSLGWMLSHEFEMIILIISLCVASYSLIEGYIKVHRNAKVILLAILGFALLVIGHEITIQYLGATLSTLGGVSILISHFINFRLRNRSCNLAAN